jgi:XTP/dITP diphosphohydrolase
VTRPVALPARVLLATRNEGKRRELAALLEPLGVAVHSLADAGLVATPDEDDLEHFETFEENALAKARHFFSRAGVPTLADDSGLVVDALDGRPGVRSKRFSDRTDLEGRELDAANNATLMVALEGVSARTARFVCVAAYVDGSRELTRRGEIEGRILDAPRGEGGFGYDPYFYSSELGLTLAEASLDEKGAVSHRGRALRALCDALVGGSEDAAGH